MRKIAFVLTTEGMMHVPKATQAAVQRVFDRPGHPHYGETRRLWVALQTLFADWKGDDLDRLYALEWGACWDTQFVNMLDDENTPAAAKREIVQRLIVAIDCA